MAKAVVRNFQLFNFRIISVKCFCSEYEMLRMCSRFFDYVSVHPYSEELKLKMKKTLRACLKWELNAAVTDVFKKTFTFSFQVIM